ncbi:MAG TPA: Type 1 glutamine amidotransferase-like domain-containing protein [Candidatus Onthousia excrementipullorum]|uniref:Type 1 glutamine amidotransferase-like domain-containing protein n=1 Tax=Candidatus Onthousia excrementipullorum TaxID=2840884 RepID=A0A9D1DTC4_9FIRM|nr:Type 1 glutamine amidotransferase-like domain-containing protein [Candidatus Onthousia excrementipullorum]
MKKLFFTSNTKHYYKDNDMKLPKEIDNTNGIVDQIKKLINKNHSILYIASDPNDYEKIDSYSSLIFEAFKLSNITFSDYLVLDNRTKDKASEYISKVNVIFLSGGDTFIENKFFEEIKLKELLHNYNGIIIGQSAGSINMANSVYNSPEEGENSEPIYFEGLGLSNINIEPHFVLDTKDFDEMQLYQRNHIINESKKRTIYALCDGSHILEVGGTITVYGKSYLIKDGLIKEICDEGKSFCIKN